MKPKRRHTISPEDTFKDRQFTIDLAKNGHSYCDSNGHSHNGHSDNGHSDAKSDSSDIPARVENALETLSEIEREVITALFFSGSKNKSQSDIAKEYGLSPQEVEKLSEQGLRNLRGNPRNKKGFPVSWN